MRRFEKSGITGKIVERELFGESKYKERTGERSPEEFSFYRYNSCLDLLKKMQPFSPIDPKPDFAKTVHQLIYGRLGLDARQLRFYTAIESPFDIKHGVDGWFEVSLRPNTYLRVTVDLTTNPDKALRKFPADIPNFLVPHDGLDINVDREQFLEYSNSLAEQVADIFVDKGLHARERRAS